MKTRKLIRIARRFGGRGYAIAAACAVLAIGGIVLLRAPGHAVPRDATALGPTTGTFSATGTARTRFAGPLLTGEAALSQSAVLAHGTRSVLAELTFRADEEAPGAAQRMPVAIAVVLDTSGSMSGEKIVQAQNSVRQLVERMRPDDQVALVTYNHTAQVLQSLAPVSQVRGAIDAQVARIFAGGGTAIPPALDLGAAQLASAPSTHVRRVVLVSDGLDGSGRPLEAVADGLRTQAQRGLYASSLGIGADYDERFLTTIADAGSGNYAFVARGDQLEGFLARELEQASNTVVEQVAAVLKLPNGWRVTRAFGADFEGATTESVVAVGPMFRGDSRKVVVELAIDAGAPGNLSAMGVEVRYRTTSDSQQHLVVGGQLAVAAVPTVELAEASKDMEVFARSKAVVIEQEQAEAVEAWRAGDVQRAQTITTRNVAELRQLQAAAPAAAPALTGQIDAYEQDEASFGRLSAESEEGRAYGLGSNAARRARVRR